MSLYREVWRDDCLVVVDKPYGVATQSAPGFDEDVFSSLQAANEYVGLHHRLDVHASGLLLFTLKQKVNRAIANAIREHQIKRHYLALLAGNVADGSWTTSVENKDARTDVTAMGHQGGLSAVRLRLHTGRKHQIRVQAAMAGHPVVGDRRYGGPVGRRWPRLALHAHSLEFTHPITGEVVALESSVPADLEPLWSQTCSASPDKGDSA